MGNNKETNKQITSQPSTQVDLKCGILWLGMQFRSIVSFYRFRLLTMAFVVIAAAQVDHIRLSLYRINRIVRTFIQTFSVIFAHHVGVASVYKK